MSSDESKNFGGNEEVNPVCAFVSLSPVDSTPTTSTSGLAQPLPRKPVLWLGLKPLELTAMLIISALVLAASYRGWWSIGVAEAWGFVTGGICVWLVVREHLWNWPVGLANNILFFILFLRARLYADMSLQIIYFALGIYGWWNWTFGGKSGSPLAITRVSRN